MPVLDVLFGDGDLGNFGWFIGVTNAGGYYFDMGSTFGGGTSFNTPFIAPSAAGKVVRIVGVYDPAGGVIRVYVNGAVAAAGFVGPAQFDTGVNDTTIGSDSSASWPATRFSIIAAGYVPLVPSAADVLAWDTAMKANACNVAFAGSTFHWRAVDAENPPGASVGVLAAAHDRSVLHGRRLRARLRAMRSLPRSAALWLRTAYLGAERPPRERPRGHRQDRIGVAPLATLGPRSAGGNGRIGSSSSRRASAALLSAAVRAGTPRSSRAVVCGRRRHRLRGGRDDS